MGYTLLSPTLQVQRIGNNVPAQWHLSGTDAIGTVAAAGYISDAQHLGMKVGDIVWYLRTSTAVVYLSVVTVVASTGATLGASPASFS